MMASQTVPAGSRIRVAFMAAVALGLFIGGCAGGNPHPPATLDRADYFAAKGNRLEAVAAYEAFVRHNPTDSLAAEAQFRKAMIYMELKEFPLAAVEFQILRKDFPTSNRVEEAQYQEGLAYLRQVGDVERDASGALEARAHFERFLVAYPESTRRAAVTAELAGISDLLVQKRLAQVQVFRQLGRWQAVATVLDGVLEDEPGSALVPDVLWERARAAEKLDDSAGATRFYSRLASDFPQSRHADSATEAAARLKAGAGS
ncbi:MAG: outer membrane protein assembly factor BamD [bacterium]|nr:outer membrane protein assembly factor BamD [bacterium]